MIIGGVNYYVMFIGFYYIIFTFMYSLNFLFFAMFKDYAGSHVLTSA